MLVGVLGVEVNPFTPTFGTPSTRSATPLNRSVTAQMVGAVSHDQRSFLAAMARHETPTRFADVRSDHGWSQPQAGVYRQRLIHSGLIVSAGHGLIDFAIPGVAQVLDDEL